MSERPQPEDLPDDQAEARLEQIATRAYDLARTGETEALAAYVGAGLPANLTNQDGDTLLMLAAYHGHAQTVEMLIGAGADPDRLNDRGQSPLAGAIFKGEDAVVRVLLGAGADPDRGTPTARAAAEMFDRPAYLELMGPAPQA